MVRVIPYPKEPVEPAFPGVHVKEPTKKYLIAGVATGTLLIAAVGVTALLFMKPDLLSSLGSLAGKTTIGAIGDWALVPLLPQFIWLTNILSITNVIMIISSIKPII